MNAPGLTRQLSSSFRPSNSQGKSRLLLNPSSSQSSTFCGRLSSRSPQPTTPRSIVATSASSTSNPSTTESKASKKDRSHETDFVIIGSGIGGLCCAALLAHYGYSVTVCEAHYHAGGAAHGFEVEGFEFDAGPSFFAGLSGPKGKSSNPLKQVLDVINETVDCVTYNNWVVYSPEGTFPCVCDKHIYAQNIRKMGGEAAYQQWKQLEALMAPLGEGAALFPAAALRSDPGIILSAARLGPGLLRTAFLAGQLTAPFSNIVDKVVSDPWLKSFIDLECFVLSGMLAKDTITAEMAYMYTERNSGKSTIDYPMGGSKSIIDALVRGVTKTGRGQVLLRAPVEEIIIENDRAVGVRLKGGAANNKKQVIKARKAVVSNASVWDTPKLLPKSYTSSPGYKEYQQQADSTNRCGSFMHLHLGIDTTGLDLKALDCHHLIVNDWENLEAPQNVCIVSIPTVFDPSLAPEGCAVVHAYTAGNEPYDGIWDKVKPGTREYEALKEQRSECLWRALERVIPDIRERTRVKMVASPLTHERFLRRYKGTYGAAISARNGTFPGPQTSVPGLYRCGDSCQPGIGVPAAAASGIIAANTLVPIWNHLEMLNELGI